MEKGDYNFALERLSAAESYVTPGKEIKAEIIYLRGVCHEGLGQTKRAEGYFKEAASLYPETEFGMKAAGRASGRVP